ncbi:hypothetical protein QYE76_070121 [Lolium multiflorum]|uniref:Helitron helicase-like domain-containing protein n=1 Tax=Lolium multiflorum TaxID=4521 RepID=A0AAD8SJ19_LOLMU|nr:hypothetical protein QYE76_070121 [Lolium multiflorum]
MRPGIFNPILHGKRLFQQFAVDTYIKIENSRLDYIWNNQDKIRADLYQGLMDSLHAGEGSADAIGKRTVLSTSFIGGPRDKRRRYMDAMALVRKYGKPDIFLTMTCNPNWDEIKRELYPGQTPQDRPDLVVRVFRVKLEELKNKLLHKDILGKVKAYVYVVEFQKRGLPHAHFLLIMEGRFKLTCPENSDPPAEDESDEVKCLRNSENSNMNKELPELFGMLKAAEIEIKKEHQVLMVNKTTSFKKQGKSKGKFKKGGKKAATPPMKPKNGPKPDAECY